MSPFTQLSSALTPPFSGSAIDRNFSPFLSYIDEFDRHFSHRHRFMNCFIPRFDLEEDAENYYLFGELPGAKVEDIGVEIRQGDRLFIWGKTIRENVGGKFFEGGKSWEGIQTGGGQQGNGEDFHNNYNDKGVTVPKEYQIGQDKEFIPLSDSTSNGEQYHAVPTTGQNGNHVLLSERLVGEFNRTFVFPSPVVEEGIQASMDAGVLKLVVPKQLGGGKEKVGKRIEVLRS